jgi:transketolase
MGDIEQLCVNAIRVLAMDAVEQAASGHPEMPMGMADAAFVLWTRHLRHNPKNPAWPDRDRFILSAGHGSMLLYALLHLSGVLALDDIRAFRQWESRTPGHPEYGLTPGVEVTTGPLGQGFAAGVGMAIAERWLAERFNRPGHTVVDHFTYGIVSDGDLMEGISYEAASLAGHLGLGRLIYLYDDNDISIDGPTDLAFSEDVRRRFEACGWQVLETDGHDRRAVDQALTEARRELGRPSLLICHTHIAFGSPGKQDSAAAHGAPLGGEEVRRTKRVLGYPEEPPFYVPPEVYKYFAALGRRWAEQEADWWRRFLVWRSEFPDLAAEWDLAMAGRLPDGWEELLPRFGPDQAMPTREASGRVLNALAEYIPWLVGGSADLSESTRTYLAAYPTVRRGKFGGRNIHFGVREHAMGGILNGLALHGGIIPYGGTFLVFSDYMRPAIRLAAIMRLPVVYIFSHDSLFVGEDGPTHQPVEHLASLRAIPNLTVIRPADAAETVEAWRVALSRRDGPVALVLTRQKVPACTGEAAAGLRHGAYVLREASRLPPDVILIASGSEVCLALEAAGVLEGQGIAARVVSMPSWELFEAQPEAYRRQVLPPEVRARVVVEAAHLQGWEKYTGPWGRGLGLERFGASAPYRVLAEKFGFTVDRVVELAEQAMAESRALNAVTF